MKTAEQECAGVYRVVECVARHLGEFGYTVHVLFLAPGPLEDVARKAGFETSTIAWDGTLRDLAGAWRFWRWMRAQQTTDVVHFHHGGRAARLLARLAGARAVVRHVHGRVEESADAPIVPMEFRYADAVIACSEAVAEHITGCRPEVIYTGIALQVEVPPAARATGPLRAGMLARLIPLKQVDVAIEACARLAERGIAMKLEIAGAGPCEQDLRALATRRGVGEQVHLLGWRSDVEELLETWEVLVLPSIDEGFPVAALEAMASGRAVVASRTGGLCELIADGETGLLFSPEDVDALTECLAAMAADRERLAEMGAAGWRRAHEKFTGIEMARSTAAIYDRLLHG